MMLIQVASMSLVLVVNIFVGRLLGPELFGEYSYALSLVMMLSMLSQFGMGQAIVRNVSRYTASEEGHLLNRFLGNVLLFSLGVAFFISFAGLVVLKTYVDTKSMSITLEQTLWIGCLSVPIFVLTPMLTAVLRASKRVALAFILNQLTRPLILFSVLGVVMLSSRALMPDQLLAINSLAYCLPALVAFLLIKKLTPVSFEFVAREVKRREWVKLCAEFFWISLLAKMIFDFGTIIVGTFVDTTEAGYFFIAVRLASLLGVVLVATNGILGPMISGFHEKDNMAEVERIYRLGLRFSIVLSVLMAAVLIVCGQWILCLYGDGFEVAYPLMVVMVIGQLGNAFVGSTGLVLNMTGHQGVSVKILMVFGPLNLVLLVIGAHYFGALGAAIATSFSNICVNVVTALLVWKRLGIVPLPFSWSSATRA